MIAVVFALAFEHAGFGEPPLGSETWVLNCTGRTVEDAFRRRLETSSPPHLVVMAGLAGALDPSLHVGDLVVDARDATLPGLRVDPWKPVKINTTGGIVTTARAKKALFEQGAGNVCEMESAFVRKVCIAKKIPFLSLRSISDDASSSLPVPSEVLLGIESGRPVPFKLVLHLLTHPTKIVPFLEMLQHAANAKTALHEELVPTLRDLARSGCFRSEVPVRRGWSQPASR